MSKTLTIDMFADRVASLTGLTPEETTPVVTAIFDAVRSKLLEHPDDKAALPGIGSFSVAHDGEHLSVIFVPDPQFAEEVNEPFAMFEPIELDNDDDMAIAESDIMPDRPQPDAEAHPSSDADADPIISDSPEAASPAMTIAADTPTQPQHDAEAESDSATATATEPQAQPTPPAEAIDPAPTPALPLIQPQPHKAYRLGWLSLGIVIGGIIGFLTAALIYSSDEPRQTAQPATAASSGDTATASADNDTTGLAAVQDVEAPVETGTGHVNATRTDTVTARRYITHMAKEYYGDRAFWVYIYEANTDVLSHPEKTLPGTVVRIPDRNSIPADPHNPEDLRQARRLAAEIYARFAD